MCLNRHHIPRFGYLSLVSIFTGNEGRKRGQWAKSGAIAQPQSDDHLGCPISPLTPAPFRSDSDSLSRRHLFIPTLPSGTSYTDDKRLNRSTFFGRKKYVDEHPIISCRPTKMTMIRKDGEDPYIPALPVPLTFPAVQFVAPNPSTKFDSKDANISKT